MTAIRRDLMDVLQQLDAQAQQRVLEFARSIQEPTGEPVADLIQHMQEIAFPPADLQEIADLIEAEFEQIRGDELDVPVLNPR
ncbi:MAG: hypothetical protein JNM70_06785 [Anaerolineae bacterium]|nr:hypothetical protein [Anaerolineae bacterium]